MNKIIKEKCDAYKAKEILGYKNRKTFTTPKKENKREETRSGQREKENTNKIEMSSKDETITSPQLEKATVAELSLQGQKRREEIKVPEGHMGPEKTEQ